jgi:hypothetical protein
MSSGGDNNASSSPKRYIFNYEDMEHFKASQTKRDLLSFVTALGKSTIASSYTFDPSNPLIGLSPGMASLHGSLQGIASCWLQELPPDETARARFGNPVFKTWHARLLGRSRSIIESIMNCHVKYLSDVQVQNNGKWSMEVLKQCSEAGRRAATGAGDGGSSDTVVADQVESESTDSTASIHQNRVIVELQAYLHHSFGHEIRLDYGTGHECSFYVFLYSLCKIGIFGNIPKTLAPSHDLMAPVALAITSQYLEVCRGIQTQYMLEPAGSHGVWGLDDYHCIPFYIGACQMQNEAYGDRDFTPSSIHNDNLLKSNEGFSMLYFQCIRYIKSLKKGVPFFECSPMLDDISNLNSWSKVSGGLLRLFEGEVLDKKPVVQHFVFGDIFKASWEPSRGEKEAPSTIFNDTVLGVKSVAPWALKRSGEERHVSSTGEDLYSL